MTYSYSGDPSASPGDAVRYLVSDTAAPWAQSDEEIAYALTRNKGKVTMAAADVADVLATRYASDAFMELVGDVRVVKQLRASAMAERAKRLRENARLEQGERAPTGFGFATDIDWQPDQSFWIGQHDNFDAATGPTRAVDGETL